MKIQKNILVDITPIIFFVAALLLSVFMLVFPANVSADHYKMEYCRRTTTNASDRQACLQNEANNMTTRQFCEWLHDGANPPMINSCISSWNRHTEGDPDDVPDTIPEQRPPNEECREITVESCGIIWYIVRGTQLLSALVGIVVVIMIAVGGISYAASRDNPQAVQKAKGHIVNALLALAVYIFTMAILQWLIPGGIFQ